MEDKRGFFSMIFIGMMTYTALVWIWTVALIFAWPWEKSSTWQEDFRIPAMCTGQKLCAFPYKDLAKAQAAGEIESLKVPEHGELLEEENWLKWGPFKGTIEAKTSSWNFQTTVRYTLENDTPVLQAYQEIGAKTVFYGMGAALFTWIGIYLRRLRG